jgi:hypothetical protein
VAQGVARRKSRVSKAQQVAPAQALPAQKSQWGPAQLVSQPVLLVRELRLAEALPAQVLPPQVLLLERPLTLGPLASRPRAAGPVQPEEQQEEQPQALRACAEQPSRPLLSPTVRLPPRFQRPLRPSDDS